jgi:hypothetical protein
MICESCLEQCTFRIFDDYENVCQRCFSKRHAEKRRNENRIRANIVEDNPTVHDLMKKWNSRKRFDN